MSIRRGLVAVIGAGLLLIPPTAANAEPAVQPALAGVGSSCPTMQIVGVRGSGETADDAEGYGTTVKAVVDAVRAVNPTAAATAIDYPAISVQWWNPRYYTSKYTNSVRTGVANTMAWINTFLAGPCGQSTYLYLVGYSQGAQVVGDVFQNKMTAGQRSRVAGLAMLGDPKFNGRQGPPVDVGTYRWWDDGVEGQTTAVRWIPKGQQPQVRSYCLRSDPVCNFTYRASAACGADLSNCPHLHYLDATYPKTSLTYTQMAADYLLGRWRKLGPKPPQVGPRSNILIFGDADTGESTTGIPNLTTALTQGGYTVTYSPDLPADLSPYGQVWFYGAYTSLGGDTGTELVNYARSGGSLYLTGEWSGCCGTNGEQPDVANIFDQLVVSVGGLQFGSDQSGTGEPVNANALDGVAISPNKLTTFTGSSVGAISNYNIGADHFLVTDPSGNGTLAAWDNNDLVGGGRLVIVMDVNWAQSEYGDMSTMPFVAQNLAYFLSGATSPNAVPHVVTHFVPATPGTVHPDTAGVPGPAGVR